MSMPSGFFSEAQLRLITGVLAGHYGPVFGGLFLAFPAIFPASATLVEKHEREKKRRAGIAKTSSRARGCCARTRAVQPSEALALSVSHLQHGGWCPLSNGAIALFAALVVWMTISILIWRLRRHRLFLRKGHAGTASHAPVSSKAD